MPYRERRYEGNEEPSAYIQGGADEANPPVPSDAVARYAGQPHHAEERCSAGAPGVASLRVPSELPCPERQDPGPRPHRREPRAGGELQRLSSGEMTSQLAEDEAVDRADLERGSRGLSTPISLGAGEMTGS